MSKKKNKLNFVQKILVAAIPAALTGASVIIVAVISNNNPDSNPGSISQAGNEIINITNNSGAVVNINSPVEINSSNTSTSHITTESSKEKTDKTIISTANPEDTSEPILIQHDNIAELSCDGARAIIFDSDTCTAYIDDEYIKTHAIGNIKDNRKIIGWSVTFTTPYDVFELVVQLDWEIPNNKSTMRGVVALNSEQLVDQDKNITLNTYNTDVQILFDSTTLPIDLTETYQICINDIFNVSSEDQNQWFYR